MDNNNNVKLTSIETEAFLNAEILNITLKIKKDYPELAKYIDEMPITIPNVKDPEITRENLKLYLESLKSALIKYDHDHHDNLD